jgi:hypothetical protein
MYENVRKGVKNMNRQQILESINLKKRFVKDCNLPITVFHEPYFSERLATLDKVFGCLAKWDIFCEGLENFSNEQDYLEMYNSVKDTVIEYIKAKPEFEKFTNDNSYIKLQNRYPKRDVYITDNIGGYFISIDMKSANFSALRRYDEAIVDGKKTWEEFLAQFTNIEHIINSKYIRQVILGACNPKKQIQFELYLMHNFLDFIEHMVPGIKVYSLGVDEIILYHPRTYRETDAEDMTNRIRECLDRHVVGRMVKFEEFYLDELYQGGYQKVDMNNLDKIIFKCVDAETFHQHVKRYFDEEITDNDLVFYHNGVLARFLEPIPQYFCPIANS